MEFQNKLLTGLQGSGALTEQIIPTREEALSVTDLDGTVYVLKTYFEGKECNINDFEECVHAVETLADIHPSMVTGENLPFSDLLTEFEKHNRELKKVRSYLRQKSQKSNFEIYLQQNFERFYDIALETTEGLKSYGSKMYDYKENEKRPICHGDFWYHNLLMTSKGYALVNFEKCAVDHQVKDLYHFLRKLLEKNNWSIRLADTLINAYHQKNKLSVFDLIQMYYRFSYPEKFWKIANFYYNGQKVWIPDKTCEKLTAVLEAQAAKEEFLGSLSSLMH